MKGMLHVTARTIVERRNVFAAAAVAALLPLLAPLLPSAASTPAADARTAAATIIGTALALAVALLHGATCLARDLRERRMSFFLARPLPAASLWLGRVLAGVLLSAATLLITWLPTTLLGATPPRVVLPPSGAVGAVLAALLGTVLLGHALAVTLSSRSAWLALDIAALAALATAALLLLRTIRGTGASRVFAYAVWSLLAAAVAALVLAGLAQVASGRADARRGHRALSIALWGGLAAAVALLGGYTVFLTHPTPRSLVRIHELELAPAGSHVVIGGTPAWRGDYFARFLLDTASGDFVRIAPSGRLASNVVLAPECNSAFWLQHENGGSLPTARLIRCEMGAAGRRPVPTPLVMTIRGTVSLAVSLDGRLAAIHHEGLLSLFEVATGTLRTSARLPGGQRWALLDFVGVETLRVEQVVEGTLSGANRRAVLAFGTEGGAPRQTATLTFASLPRLSRHLVAARPVMLVSHRDGPIVTTEVLDAWTGAQIANLAAKRAGSPPGLWETRLAALADGRFAVAEAGTGTARLRLYSHDWVAESAYEIGPAMSFAIGAELEPGTLPFVITRLTGTGPSGPTPRDECLLLDLATGKTTPLAEDTRPLASTWWVNGGRPVGPATPAARLFISDSGEFSTWDPATRRLRRLFRTHD